MALIKLSENDPRLRAYLSSKKPGLEKIDLNAPLTKDNLPLAEKIASKKIGKNFSGPDWLKNALLHVSSSIAQHPKINSALEATKDIVDVPYSAELGAAQGIGNSVASIINTPQYLAKLMGKDLGYHVQMPDLSNKAADTPLSKLAFKGSEMISPLALPFGAQTKATSEIGKLVSSGLGGFLSGEDESGSRLLSTAIGAGVPVVGRALKDLKSASYKNIGHDILQSKKKFVEKYREGYKDLFKKMEERGIDDSLMPTQKIKLNVAKNFLDKETSEAIHHYEKNPTIVNAHKLQSDLGKRSSELRSGSNTIIERDAAKEIENTRNQLRHEMITGMSRLGHTDLGLKYAELTHGYKTQVAPYLKKAVSDIQESLYSGESPKTAIKKLMQDSKFVRGVKGAHPGFEDRKIFNHVAGILKDLGIPIASILGLSKLFGG